MPLLIFVKAGKMVVKQERPLEQTDFTRLSIIVLRLMAIKLLNQMNIKRHGTLLGGIVIAILMSKTKVLYGDRFLEGLNKMKNLLLIVTLLFFTSSCRWISEADTPFTMGMGFKIPDGTPVFKKGFYDGCSQLFYARGNGFYRWRHKYHYNPKMHQNPEYRFGYKRGMSYCFNSIVPGVASSDRYLFWHKGQAIVAQDYNTVGIFPQGGLSTAVPQAKNGGLDGVMNAFWGKKDHSVFGTHPLWAGGAKGQFFGLYSD